MSSRASLMSAFPLWSPYLDPTRDNLQRVGEGKGIWPKYIMKRKKQNTRWERGLETPFNRVPTLGTLAPGSLDALSSIILGQETYEVLLVICLFSLKISFWISLYSGLRLLVVKRGMVAFNEQGHLCGSRDGWRGVGMEQLSWWKAEDSQ